MSEPPSSSRLATEPVTGAKILVADDDRLSRELLANMLRSRGFDVEAVEDGQVALERVGAGRIDLVLLDVLMPRLSGLEACRLLKGSVKSDTASRVEGLKIGAEFLGRILSD